MKILFQKYINKKLSAQWLAAEFLETSSLITGQIKAGGIFAKAAKASAKASAEWAAGCDVSSFFKIHVNKELVGYARMGVGVDTFGNVLRDIYIRKSKRGNGYLRPIILQMENEFGVVMAELGDLTAKHHRKFWHDLGYTATVRGPDSEYFAYKPEIAEKILRSPAYSNKVPFGYQA